MRAIESCGTDNGIDVEMLPVDRVNTSFSDFVDFTGDDGNIGLEQRLKIAFSRSESESVVNQSQPPHRLHVQIRNTIMLDVPFAPNVELRNQFRTQFFIVPQSLSHQLGVFRKYLLLQV